MFQPISGEDTAMTVSFHQSKEPTHSNIAAMFRFPDTFQGLCGVTVFTFILYISFDLLISNFS